jgi:aminomethyltransferase
MPLSYTSQIEEHLRTRRSASLFDVSHMGEIWIQGEDATRFCEWLLPNRVESLAFGDQANYHPMCRSDGTVVDDLLLYAFRRDSLLLVVNAANYDKDVAFLSRQATEFGLKSQIHPVTDRYAQVAVQGPRARELVMRAYPDWSVLELKRFRFWCPSTNLDWVVSRTGYTGEDGFEIYLPPEEATPLCERLMQVAQQSDIELGPSGLGARDTLRLEAGLPLYGHELDDEHTAVESGLKMFCDFTKADFCGKHVLQNQAENPKVCKEALRGLISPSRRAPRAGQLLQNAQGETVGRVVSGALGPSVGQGIGTAFVQVSAEVREGDELTAISPQGRLGLKVRSLPFYSSLKPKASKPEAPQSS